MKSDKLTSVHESCAAPNKLAGLEPRLYGEDNGSGEPLRVLIVEDMEDDALLMADALRRGGHDTTWERVDTPDAMDAALDDREWDIILADFSMPRFSALAALELTKQRGLDLPFILVSATIGEENAVQAMKHGAHDYVMKDKLARLLPAVERELREAKVRREHRNAEKARRDALAESRRRGAEVSALLEGARKVLMPQTFKEAARGIFDSCKNLIGASGGYVALLNEDTTEIEVLFADSAGQSCALDPSLPVPIRGLSAEVYRTRKPAYDNEFSKSKRVKFIPKGHVTLENVLLVPMMIGSKTAGMLGFSNKPEGFNGDDARMAAAFAELASIALINSRATESLENSEERYRDLYENAPNAYFSIAADGSITACNRAAVELLDYDRETLMGTKIWDVYADTPHGRPKAQEIHALLIEGELIRDVELQMERRGGEPIWVSISVEPIRDREDHIIESRLMVIDVSERKKLEAQFIQAQKMESIGTLAGGVAHDFNNLLGGILGYASFMKTKMEEDHPFYKYIDTIEKSATRAAQLTARLLGFARTGQDETMPVDLNEIITETMNILGRTIDKSIEIKTDLLKNLPTIEADAGRLQQAIINLCVNARDAMAEEGVLSIETRVEAINKVHAKAHPESKEGSFAVLSVTDTGTGMDKRTKEKIFEPFFTTKEEGKGTGLGLAMVYGVVKNLGGFIWVYSEPGVGSTFKIYLPISGLPEMEEHPVAEAPRGGTELVLVVDDEEPIRALAKETLESFGYKVMLAEDGREAIRLYEKHKEEIDLVILDMVMPKMGGRETFSGLKQISSQVKALLSTGYSQSGRAQEILDGGVMGFIQKPYKLSDLLSTVRRTLDGAM